MHNDKNALVNRVFKRKINSLIQAMGGTKPFIENSSSQENDSILSNYIFAKGIDAIAANIPSGPSEDSKLKILTAVNVNLQTGTGKISDGEKTLTVKDVVDLFKAGYSIVVHVDETVPGQGELIFEGALGAMSIMESEGTTYYYVAFQALVPQSKAMDGYRFDCEGIASKDVWELNKISYDFKDSTRLTMGNPNAMPNYLIRNSD